MFGYGNSAAAVPGVTTRQNDAFDHIRLGGLDKRRDG